MKLGHWELVQWVCCSLYRLYKTKLKPIPVEDADPIAVFKETWTDLYLNRFIPFVVWLKDRPRNFHYFCAIEENFPDLVPCLSSLLRRKFSREDVEKEESDNEKEIDTFGH